MSGFTTATATDVDDRPHDWTSDKWATPWPVIQQLEERYGAFDLDPCCEERTAKAPVFYTVDVDGLAGPWFGINGMRVSEVCGIDIEDMDRHQGQRIVSILRKGGKYQLVPLVGRVAWQVEETIGSRTSGPLFLDHSGTKRLDRRAAGRIVSRVVRDAGIMKRITPHSLRHTFVTMSLDAGRSERDIAASVGHADSRLVAYYDRGRDSIYRNTSLSVLAFVEGAL